MPSGSSPTCAAKASSTDRHRRWPRRPAPRKTPCPRRPAAPKTPCPRPPAGRGAAAGPLVPHRPPRPARRREWLGGSGAGGRRRGSRCGVRRAEAVCVQGGSHRAAARERAHRLKGLPPGAAARTRACFRRAIGLTSSLSSPARRPAPTPAGTPCSTSSPGASRETGDRVRAARTGRAMEKAWKVGRARRSPRRKAFSTTGRIASRARSAREAARRPPATCPKCARPFTGRSALHRDLPCRRRPRGRFPLLVTGRGRPAPTSGNPAPSPDGGKIAAVRGNHVLQALRGAAGCGARPRG